MRRNYLNSKEMWLEFLHYSDKEDASPYNPWTTEPFIQYRDRFVKDYYDKVVSETLTDNLFFLILPYLKRYQKFQSYEPITYDEIDVAFEAATEIDFVSIYGKTDKLMPQVTAWVKSLAYRHGDQPIKSCFVLIDYFMNTEHKASMKLIEEINDHLSSINADMSVRWSVNPYAQYPDFDTGVTLIVCF